MPTLSTPEARLAVAIGWSLLQILWQGLLLGIVLAVALRAMRNSPATTRYALCCGALVALVLCPLLTLILIELTGGHPAATALLARTICCTALRRGVTILSRPAVRPD